MNILVDEHIPLMTVQALRASGHDIKDIRGTPDEGIQDEALWHIAQKEQRLLITTDKGFSQYRTTAHHGVLIVLLKKPNRRRIHHRIMQAIDQFAVWPGLLVVMRDRAQSLWQTKNS